MFVIPGQWAPDRTDGKKMYERDFLMALKNFPASLQKPDNIPDSVLQDERNVSIVSIIFKYFVCF